MPILDDEDELGTERFRRPPPEGIEFHYHSRFIPIFSDPDFHRIRAINNDPETPRRLNEHQKVYPLARKTVLCPVLSEIEDATLLHTLLNRRSVRRFSGAPMKSGQLANLLVLSGGRMAQCDPLRRAAPSAGGRNPIEIYPFVLNVTGVESGIHHFNSAESALSLLTPMSTEETSATLKRLGFGGAIEIERACVVIVMTAVFRRTVGKYGRRGWRFIFEDAGHIGQNIGLVATAMGLSSTANGGGFDSEIARVLELNQLEEGFVLAYIVGGSIPDAI